MLLYDLSDNRIIYCRDEGCANETKSVFCGDVNHLKDIYTIEPCRGPPRLKEVCQQESRAYVNTTEKSCDFERLDQEDPHLPTSECTGFNGFYLAFSSTFAAEFQTCVDISPKLILLAIFFSPILKKNLLLKQHNI